MAEIARNFAAGLQMKSTFLHVHGGLEVYE